MLLIVVMSLLWHMSLSTHECNRTVNPGVITFLCPSTVANQELRLYDLTVDVLDGTGSIVATGRNGAVGPFTSIPPNICLLRNLRKVDFSFNQITDADPIGALNNCFSQVTSLRLSSNNISQFPSVMIYNMRNLIDIDFQQNQLTDVPPNAFANLSVIESINLSNNQLTTFELWTLEVRASVDLSYNRISMITNKYLYNQFLNTTNEPNINLNGNGPTINLTDAIYEMYNQCAEVDEWYVNNPTTTNKPYFTRRLSQIYFGTTQIICNCDQLYFLQILQDSFGTIEQIPPFLPIARATCINDSLNMNNATFFNSSCASPPFDINSTVNFSRVYPRFCKIYSDEGGNLTNSVNITAPTLNVSTYPHYETAFLTPGACFFTFINQTSMTAECTNDTSNTNSKIPGSLLSNPYMLNIKRVTFSSSLSILPSYLCDLPSREIDLSYQAFTTLTDATFPCLDSFSKVSLSYNQLTSVNMASGNFQNLNFLDLSSNRLTTIPYTILRPTPSSLRYLDLRNNSINSIDLFIYTVKNISIYLDNNPINSSNIINPQNVTLDSNSTSSVNITFPPSVTNSSIIIQDITVASLIACTSFNSIRSFLLNLRSASPNVLLLCTCASFSLRQLYQANGLNITNDFSCSVASDAITFQSFTNTSCPNAIHFQTVSCDQTNQPSNTITTSQSNSDRTGLIVGLVVGIVGFCLLLGALIAAFLISKAKRTAAAGKKHVSRAKVIGRSPGDTLSSRVQPRNLRTMKLAPLATPTSGLPKVPVATAIPTGNSSLLYYPYTKLGTPAKGIPIRLDAIRSPSDISPQYPPNSNALNNSSSFRPVNNISTHQVPIPQQQPQGFKPPPHQMLNAGGDLRY